MIKNLTTEEFKDQIFDYDNQKTFVLKSKNPVIIDFWAPWCGPCKTLTPLLEQLSVEYENIDIIKINVDEAHEVGAVFNIRSIPTMLFVPKNGEPDKIIGSIPKTQIVKMIEEVILNPIISNPIEVTN